MLKLILLLSLVFPSLKSNEIQQNDSLKTYVITEVEVIEGLNKQSVIFSKPENETYIFEGKKSETLMLENIPLNSAEKTGRNLFGRIPGAFIYDMDGSGNQINLSLRGLDAHRSWELNVRQNGVILNSDIYGYPASHYSMPLESIEKIEIVRGTASLQYGQQFGGMINYVTKSADTSKIVTYEGINSIGSFGLFNNYNSIGGKIGKISYYAYYNKRISEGYRDNSNSESESQFVSLNYEINENLTLKSEFGRNKYTYKLPGPLTDNMFLENPKQSIRERNYYSPDIYVPSFTLDWKLGDNTKLNIILSGIFGDRNSVQFEGLADKLDIINNQTGNYGNRAVHIDKYNSKTAEMRLSHSYKLFNIDNKLISGLRYFNNDLNRRQRGISTSDLGFNINVVDNFWGRNINFKSQSIAFFTENLFKITERFSVSPGLRYEVGNSKMTGIISDIDFNDLTHSIDYNFPTFGVSSEYKINYKNRIYAGLSQANRPVLFKDIIPSSTLEAINQNLEHSTGYNIEIGAEGLIANILTYNFTYFNMQYNNRIGSMLEEYDNTNLVVKRNIGNSTTNGVELYLDYIIFKKNKFNMSFFNALSLIEAKYNKGTYILNNNINQDISNNKVEATPFIINRNAINIIYLDLNVVIQHSFVSESFSDPLNTRIQTQNGAIGIVPSYHLTDINLSYIINKNYKVNFGINNIFNKQYFTRRPLFYPGPGIWSSDGRGFYLTLNIKIS